MPGELSGSGVGNELLSPQFEVPDRPPIEDWRRADAIRGELQADSSVGVTSSPAKATELVPPAPRVDQAEQASRPEVQSILNQIRAVYADADFTRVDFVPTVTGFEIKTYDYAGNPLGNDLAYLQRRLGPDRYQQVLDLTSQLERTVHESSAPHEVVEKVVVPELTRKPSLWQRLRGTVEQAKRSLFGVDPRLRQPVEKKLNEIEVSTSQLVTERIGYANREAARFLHAEALETRFQQVVGQRGSREWWNRDRGNRQYLDALQLLSEQLTNADADYQLRIHLVTEKIREHRQRVQAYVDFHHLAEDPSLQDLFRPHLEALGKQTESLYLEELDLRRKLQHLQNRRQEVQQELGYSRQFDSTNQRRPFGVNRHEDDHASF